MDIDPIWFLLCILALTASAPLHVRSVMHSDLRRRHGPARGASIGRAYAMASGTMESIFLVALWLAPQARFWLPVGTEVVLGPIDLRVSLPGVLVGAPLLAAGAWLGLRGLALVGMRTADTHETPSRLRTEGVYSAVRHPQYLGWVLAHVGVSVLLSALWALLATPLVVVIVLVISRAEEQDLVEAFGDEYVAYAARVPMLLPRP